MTRRAFKVDPFTRTVEVIEFEDFTTARAVVGTGNLDHAILGREDETTICLFVDGEGYYKPDMRWWSFAGYSNPLAGIGVIYGADEAGEDADVDLPLARMTGLVSWIEGRPQLPGATAGPLGGEPIVSVDFNAPDAPKSVEEFYARMFGEEPPKRKP